MRVLVTGNQGQLGHDAVLALQKRGHDAVGVDVGEMDVSRAQDVRQTLVDVRPEAVIHCAAYTAVDAAEDNAALCRKVNVNGTANIARVCGDHAMKMIYISTDYVFDGEGTRPWEPDDPVTKPLNVYGQSKYDGELAVREYADRFYIVRTSWVFGAHGKNFVKTMLKRGRERESVSVVDDQIGSPTYTSDLAELLADMAETDRYGIYHAANAGYCSWYEFAKEIFRAAGMDADLRAVSSDAYPSRARRPHNSRMNMDKLDRNGFRRLPPWQDAVKRYLEVIR